jgi:carbonic anhydrase
MKTILNLSILALLLTFGACTGANRNVETTADTDRTAVNNSVLTAERQAALTPQMVIEYLRRGNDDFVNNRLTILNTPERVRTAAAGQFPKAVILSCLDSRVPVEDVFHKGIGDLFVARVAGNIVNPDILGSMEFACKASGARLVMVLGHGYCGAVKHAISNTELGNITGMLSRIKPAVAETKSDFEGDTSVNNAEFVTAVTIQNIALAVQQIREQSPILREMEKNGEIKIIGAYYDMYTGRVEFFENM